MDYREMRLKNLEATVSDLRRERREDRTLIKEILAQVLSLTEQQTRLLQEWTSIMHARQTLLEVKGKPISYTFTPEEEYRRWAEKHHPELLEEDTDSSYNTEDESSVDREG